MPKAKGISDEDTFLLYADNERGKFDQYSQAYYQSPIIQGVVCHLRRWPYDLLFTFLAACLIIGSLMLLIFVTVLLCLPTIITNRCRVEGLEILNSNNVYFLKLENNTWSTREFCYVETAAREHPNLNVYIINLSSHENIEKRNYSSLVNNSHMETGKYEVSRNVSDFYKSNFEDHIQRQLATKIPNIKSINVSVKKFFKGSKLSKIAKTLRKNTLEIAIRAHLLWNYPGVVLNPSMYCNLKSMEEFMCKTKRGCSPDELTTIDVTNNIQATGVPCQAFMDFLMHNIIKNRMDENFTLQAVINRYCPGMHYCPEIRNLNLRPDCSLNDVNCPVVHSTDLLRDDINFKSTSH